MPVCDKSQRGNCSHNNSWNECILHNLYRLVLAIELVNGSLE